MVSDTCSKPATEVWLVQFDNYKYDVLDWERLNILM